MPEINVNQMLRIIFTLLSGMVICSSCSNSEPQKNILNYTGEAGNLQTVRSIHDWQIKRSRIIDSMEAVMGDLPDLKNLPSFNTAYSDSIHENTFTRYTIRFTVAENEIQTAYLYVPHGSPGKKFPAMLALHETDSIGKKSVDGQGKNKNLAYARELAERGYVVIAPDYPGFGELTDYDFETDRYQSATMKAVFNHIRCIDFLGTLPEVDTSRIGVIGHSLGGHNSIFAGAFDQRLKVIVSSCGWTPFTHYNIGELAVTHYGGRLGPWAQDKYMPLLREKYQLDETRIPFDFPEVIAALAPRAFFSNSPQNDSNFDVNGVRLGISEANKVFKLFNRESVLRARYPLASHDFPVEVRMEAYRFIDSVLEKSN